jgi:hypothetical protein
LHPAVVKSLIVVILHSIKRSDWRVPSQDDYPFSSSSGSAQAR